MIKQRREAKKRTRFNLWTPSLERLERNLTISNSSSPFLSLYRLCRFSYFVMTTPLHLLFLALSSPPISVRFPSIFDDEWTAIQKLVYPCLRRIIWSFADVGDPNVLTRSTRSGETPLWAWALEEFTVWIGRGDRVDVEKRELDGLPREARVRGWVIGEELNEGTFDKVNLFWFERRRRDRRRNDKRYDRLRPRSEDERVVMYLFGGGFVCGSPGEGGRCYKIARETGLRVVGVNYRRATSLDRAFPAALQDALSCYFHLTLELGYRDVVLAGDSAGGGLALNLLQYLAGTLYPSLSDSGEKAGFILPSAILLISPWTDLTLESFPEAANTTDIILPSICSNSVRAYLGRKGRESREPNKLAVEKRNDTSASGASRPIRSIKDPSHHPWFSPSLPSSLPALRTVAKAYSSPSSTTTPTTGSPPRRTLRILVTLGTAELFYPSLLSLVGNLRSLEEEGSDRGKDSGILVETIEGKGEVHAFPLIPEWVSPNAVKSWERLRLWFKE